MDEPNWYVALLLFLVLSAGFSFPAFAQYNSGQITRTATLDYTSFNANPPTYPLSALTSQHQGQVVLLVHVGPDNNITNVQVDVSSGFKELDKAARAAAFKWNFDTHAEGNPSVVGVARVPVTFTLPADRSGY